MSAFLLNTEKGVGELKHRTHKLSMRQRSLLLLLDKPRTIEQVLEKSLYPRDDVVLEIQVLVRDGFVSINKEGTPIPPRSSSALSDNLGSLDDIALPEAKFQLINFCLDNFGTHSPAFVDEISALQSVRALGQYLGNIFSAAQRICPEQLPSLHAIVEEIKK